MEGAVRLFAGEFSRSGFTVQDGDDRSAAWVVTPSGAFCRQVFLAGALVEVHEQGDALSARLADPTGGFDLVLFGNSTPLSETIRKIPLPSFVSVAGRAQLYRNNGKSVLTIRPEQIRIIDRTVRDQWVITTAAATLARLDAMRDALAGTSSDPRVLQAIRHYSVTREDLGDLAGMAAGALASVRPSQEQEPSARPDPREMILECIRQASGPRGISVDEILDMAGLRGVSRETALAAIESLIVDDECYQPQKGFLKLL
jgi:RPA family protein